MSGSGSDNVKPTRIWLLLLMGVAILAVIGATAAGSLWLLDRVGVKETAVRLPVLLIIGLIGLLFAIAVLVAAFDSFGLAKTDHALGLPEGSVRAMIALMLILLFAIAGLYVYGTIGETSPDVGKQLVTTLSTLVVAIAAFYFGAKAVEAGIAAGQAPGAAAGVVTLSPSDADFGSVRIGEERGPSDFSLTNRTTAEIEVTDVTLKGDQGFEVAEPRPDETKPWWTPGKKTKVLPGQDLGISTKLKPQEGGPLEAVAATLMAVHTGPGPSPTASLKGKVEPASGVIPVEGVPVEGAAEEEEVDLNLEEEEEEEEELPPDESPDATTEAGLTEAGIEPDEDVEFEDGEGEEGP